MRQSKSFERARVVADAILMEGYALYPYRATSTKNRYRWTFGVVAPRDWSESPTGSDPWWMQAECVIQPSRDMRVEGVLRFMQLLRRSVDERTEGGYHPTAELSVGDALFLPWEEGVLCEVPLASLDERQLELGQEIPFEIPGAREEEPISTAGRMVRQSWSIRGRIVTTARLEDGLCRLRLQVLNDSCSDDPSAPRGDALRRALLSAHVLLQVSGGSFVSHIDPPPEARMAVAGCENVGLYPVLAGPEGQHDLMLAAPIILYDHPQVAPESTGDLFDATEIDEILTLRTSTLTDDEKRQARSTDARTAALLDRVDYLPEEMMQRLHGAIRELRAVERTESTIPGLQPGSRVRLQPGARRTDAQDLLMTGHTATIRRVLEDVDGRTWLAVTIDDDPAAELNGSSGRFRYYYPDEVVLIDETGP